MFDDPLRESLAPGITIEPKSIYLHRICGCGIDCGPRGGQMVCSWCGKLPRENVCKPSSMVATHDGKSGIWPVRELLPDEYTECMCDATLEARKVEALEAMVDNYGK